MHTAAGPRCAALLLRIYAVFETVSPNRLGVRPWASSWRSLNIKQNAKRHTEKQNSFPHHTPFLSETSINRSQSLTEASIFFICSINLTYVPTYDIMVLSNKGNHKKKKGKFDMITKRETALRAIENGKSKIAQWDENLLEDPTLTFEAIKLDYKDIVCVPEKYLTDEMCMFAVKQDGRILRYIPKKFRTKELYEEATKSAGEALHYIPDKLITEEMSKNAIKTCGDAMNAVPEKFRTDELWLEAAEHGIGWMIKFLPEHLRTEEVYTTAVRTSDFAVAFLYIPKEHFTENMCREAVKKNGLMIMHVPEEFVSDELYEIAVTQNGNALAYIPKEKRTKKLCVKAVINTDGAINYVPKEILVEAIKEAKGL